jgi:hypothetical protein
MLFNSSGVRVLPKVVCAIYAPPANFRPHARHSQIPATSLDRVFTDLQRGHFCPVAALLSMVRTLFRGVAPYRWANLPDDFTDFVLAIGFHH